MLVDTHTHIYDKEFFNTEEAEDILKKTYKNGIKKVILIGTNATDSLEAEGYTSKWNSKNLDNIPELYWTFGIHPEFAEQEYDLDKIKSHLNNKSLVAIGEVGLDYHYDSVCQNVTENHQKQRELLVKMLDLAVDYNLPLSFHVRDAFDDFFQIVDQYTDDYLNSKGYTLNGDLTENNRCRLRAVVHSFSDSKKNLNKCLARGFYIGVNGLATYSTLPTPPLENTILETDAPFLIPAPYHEHHKPGDGSPVYGLHRNDSSYIKTIAEWKSSELGVSIEEVAKVTTENAKTLFNL